MRDNAVGPSLVGRPERPGGGVLEFVFLRIGLQRRIMVYVAVGLFVLFGTFAVLGSRTIGQSTEIIYQQRLVLATVLASGIDDYIERVGADLHHATVMMGPDADLAEWWEAYRAAAGGRDRPAPELALMRVDGQGRVTEAYPEVGLLDLTIVSGETLDRVLTGGERVFLPLTAADHPAAWAGIVLIPAAREEGAGEASAAAGVLLGDDLSLELIAPLLKSASGEPGADGAAAFAVEIVDEAGRVVVSAAEDGEARAAGSDGLSSHYGHIDTTLSAGKPTVTLHTSGPAGDHVIAAVPLSTGPAALVLEQGRDAALEMPDRLRRQVIIFGGAGLALALFVAWLTTSRVAKPAVALAAAAKQMASGKLDQPIAVQGEDEIGGLADDLESMRITLQFNQEEIESANRELEARVEDRTRRLQDVLGKVIGAQEEERLRVARDLHDQTAQSLSVLVMSLDRLARQDADSEDRAEMVARAKNLAQDILAETRRLMHALRPAALDDLGLVPAIRSYAAEQLEHSGVNVKISQRGDAGRLPRETELTLFRIAQEAINNVARHADASNVTIEVAGNEQSIEMSVVDDGRGIKMGSAEGSNSERSLGVQGMRERSRLLGGQLVMESEPGKGTRVFVEMPTTIEYGHDQSSGS